MFLLSLIFVLYQLTYRVFKRLNRKIDEVRGKPQIRRRYIKHIEGTVKDSKRYKSIYERTAAKLKKQGNPWKLTPVTYYLLKIVFTLAVIINGLYGRRNILLIVTFSIASFYFVDIIYKISNQDDNKKILHDLPDIYDMLNIQTKAGVPLGLALTEIYDIANCKRLRYDLIELAAEINIRKDPINALTNFKDKYDILEIDNFVLTLKQSLSSGKSIEMLESQGDMLKENNIFEIQEETGKMDTRFFFIAMLIFIGLVAVIVYSFTTQIQGDVIQIFK